MASGDVVFVAAAKEQLGQKIHDMDTDTFKLALITSSTTPTETTALPHFNGTGTTDWSTNEVSAGGNYSAGGVTLTSVTWTLSTATVTWDSADVTISQDGSNPTNARWGIIYNDSDANKRVLAYVDLGSDRDLSGGDFTITIGSILTLA